MKAGPTSLVATGAAYYVHDEQGRLVGQYDANRTPMHETIYFGDTPVVVLKATGSGSAGTLQITPYYVYADQIDTPRVITRASDQAIVWRWDQAEAFGASPPQDNPSGLGAFGFDQRFPGQVFDAETGNHDNGLRTYFREVGRFGQSNAMEPGINPYDYAGSSPLIQVDRLVLNSTTIPAPTAPPIRIPAIPIPPYWWLIPFAALSGDTPSSAGCKTCAEAYPTYINCNRIDYPYFSEGLAFNAARAFNFPDSIRKGKRMPVNSGPCVDYSGKHEHIQLHPVSGGGRAGALVSCECCLDDPPEGARLRTKWKAIP
jgi:RHS repeat-associated protein